MEYKEVEVRFLEVDKDKLMRRLNEVGAQDKGEKLFDERIIYDKELTWRDGGEQVLRLRTVDGETELAYKKRIEMTADGIEEIEFIVSDVKAAEALLERLGYTGYRYQQKKRHQFELDGVSIDIDTWPQIPTYVELEGLTEEDLKSVAKKLNLDWKDVVMESPRDIIEKKYNIPVGNMKWFTFEKLE
jgi:adenylate cyclase class 2